MTNGLQWWANVSQVASCIIALLSFIFLVIVWLWPNPKVFWNRARPIILPMLVGITSFSLGVFVHSLIAGYGATIVIPPEDPGVVSIKTIPLSIMAFGAEDNQDYGEGSGSAILTVDQDSNLDTNYMLTYSLPLTKEGYAGVIFHFVTPQDFQAYKFIEVTITFSDNEANCSLELAHSPKERAYLPLGGSNLPTEDSTKTTTGNRHTIRVSLEAFSRQKITMQSIMEMAFTANTFYTRGTHGFTLHDVKLIKQ